MVTTGLWTVIFRVYSVLTFNESSILCYIFVVLITVSFFTLLHCVLLCYQDCYCVFKKIAVTSCFINNPDPCGQFWVKSCHIHCSMSQYYIMEGCRLYLVGCSFMGWRLIQYIRQINQAVLTVSTTHTHDVYVLPIMDKHIMSCIIALILVRRAPNYIHYHMWNLPYSNKERKERIFIVFLFFFLFSLQRNFGISYGAFDRFRILLLLKFIGVLISVSIIQSAIPLLLHYSQGLCRNMKRCWGTEFTYIFFSVA